MRILLIQKCSVNRNFSANGNVFSAGVLFCILCIPLMLFSRWECSHDRSILAVGCTHNCLEWRCSLGGPLLMIWVFSVLISLRFLLRSTMLLANFRG